MSSNLEIFEGIKQHLQTDHSVTDNAKKGLCRTWTKSAMKAISPIAQLHPGSIQIEAREIDVEPYLSHTFLRVIIGGTRFLLDGTGVSKHDSYFGPEEEAPAYFRNSKSDMINNC